ncbi:hypothetical protein HYV81_04980 [Candidatus Woesearchaeota archaeon]|nr:hypothetical protein [Candidatus Woesearchaeota archaeon]
MPQIDIIERLLRSKSEFYITTIGILSLTGMGYVYLNHIKTVAQSQPTDIFAWMIVIGSGVLGYIFFLLGFYMIADRYSMERDLFILAYNIKRIKLTQELKKLEKKHKIKKKESRISKLRKRLPIWFKKYIHYFI